MTQRLMQGVGPTRGLGFVLEGGYDLQGLEESVAATLRATRAIESSEPAGLGEGKRSSIGARHEVELANAASSQRQYWKLS